MIYDTPRAPTVWDNTQVGLPCKRVGWIKTVFKRLCDAA